MIWATDKIDDHVLLSSEEIQAGIANQLEYLITYNKTCAPDKKWYVYVIGDAVFNSGIMSENTAYLIDNTVAIDGLPLPVDIAALNQKLIEVNTKNAGLTAIYYGITNDKEIRSVEYFEPKNFNPATATKEEQKAYANTILNPEAITGQTSLRDQLNIHPQKVVGQLFASFSKKIGPSSSAIAIAKHYTVLAKSSGKGNWYSSTYIKAFGTQNGLDKAKLKEYIDTAEEGPYIEIEAVSSYINEESIQEEGYYYVEVEGGSKKYKEGETLYLPIGKTKEVMIKSSPGFPAFSNPVWQSQHDPFISNVETAIFETDREKYYEVTITEYDGINEKFTFNIVVLKEFRLIEIKYTVLDVENAEITDENKNKKYIAFPENTIWTQTFQEEHYLKLDLTSTKSKKITITVALELLIKNLDGESITDKITKDFSLNYDPNIEEYLLDYKAPNGNLYKLLLNLKPKQIPNRYKVEVQGGKDTYSDKETIYFAVKKDSKAVFTVGEFESPIWEVDGGKLDTEKYQLDLSTSKVKTEVVVTDKNDPKKRITFYVQVYENPKITFEVQPVIKSCKTIEKIQIPVKMILSSIPKDPDFTLHFISDKDGVKVDETGVGLIKDNTMETTVEIEDINILTAGPVKMTVSSKDEKTELGTYEILCANCDYTFEQVDFEIKTITRQINGDLLVNGTQGEHKVFQNPKKLTICDVSGEGFVTIDKKGNPVSHGNLKDINIKKENPYYITVEGKGKKYLYGAKIYNMKTVEFALRDMRNNGKWAVGGSWTAKDIEFGSGQVSIDRKSFGNKEEVEVTITIDNEKDETFKLFKFILITKSIADDIYPKLKNITKKEVVNSIQRWLDKEVEIFTSQEIKKLNTYLEKGNIEKDINAAREMLDKGKSKEQVIFFLDQSFIGYGKVEDTEEQNQEQQTWDYYIEIDGKKYKNKETLYFSKQKKPGIAVLKSVKGESVDFSSAYWEFFEKSKKEKFNFSTGKNVSIDLSIRQEKVKVEITDQENKIFTFWYTVFENPVTTFLVDIKGIKGASFTTTPENPEKIISGGKEYIVPELIISVDTYNEDINIPIKIRCTSVDKNLPDDFKIYLVDTRFPANVYSAIIHEDKTVNMTIPIGDVKKGRTVKYFNVMDHNKALLGSLKVYTTIENQKLSYYVEGIQMDSAGNEKEKRAIQNQDKIFVVRQKGTIVFSVKPIPPALPFNDALWTISEKDNVLRNKMKEKSIYLGDLDRKLFVIEDDNGGNNAIGFGVVIYEKPIATFTTAEVFKDNFDDALDQQKQKIGYYKEISEQIFHYDYMLKDEASRKHYYVPILTLGKNQTVSFNMALSSVNEHDPNFKIRLESDDPHIKIESPTNGITKVNTEIVITLTESIDRQGYIKVYDQSNQVIGMLEVREKYEEEEQNQEQQNTSYYVKVKGRDREKDQIRYNETLYFRKQDRKSELSFRHDNQKDWPLGWWWKFENREGGHGEVTIDLSKPQNSEITVVEQQYETDPDKTFKFRIVVKSISDDLFPLLKQSLNEALKQKVITVIQDWLNDKNYTFTPEERKSLVAYSSDEERIKKDIVRFRKMIEDGKKEGKSEMEIKFSMDQSFLGYGKADDTEEQNQDQQTSDYYIEIDGKKYKNGDSIDLPYQKETIKVVLKSKFDNASLSNAYWEFFERDKEEKFLFATGKEASIDLNILKTQNKVTITDQKNKVFTFWYSIKKLVISFDINTDHITGVKTASYTPMSENTYGISKLSIVLDKPLAVIPIKLNLFPEKKECKVWFAYKNGAKILTLGKADHSEISYGKPIDYKELRRLTVNTHKLKTYLRTVLAVLNEKGNIIGQLQIDYTKSIEKKLEYDIKKIARIENSEITKTLLIGVNANEVYEVKEGEKIMQTDLDYIKIENGETHVYGELLKKIPVQKGKIMNSAISRIVKKNGKILLVGWYERYELKKGEVVFDTQQDGWIELVDEEMKAHGARLQSINIEDGIEGDLMQKLLETIIAIIKNNKEDVTFTVSEVISSIEANNKHDDVYFTPQEHQQLTSYTSNSTANRKIVNNNITKIIHDSKEGVNDENLKIKMYDFLMAAKTIRDEIRDPVYLSFVIIRMIQKKEGTYILKGNNEEEMYELKEEGIEVWDINGGSVSIKNGKIEIFNLKIDIEKE